MVINKVIAIVGMNGSGKSEVAGFFEEKGCTRIRFGEITDKEIAKRGLKLNEENERKIREELRREYGMAAYAKLNAPLIDEALKKCPVVVDGLYSWEEYKMLKDIYGDYLIIVAVYSSPRTRQKRLPQRQVRPLTPVESARRDYNEIENLGKGGPIAIADFTLINESSMEALKKDTEDVIGKLL
ncbi:MAG: AAA family ATPase [Dehalococcoidia bacterium]|nr:AAA family ATPase [Dehalococcoidia bacterium]